MKHFKIFQAIIVVTLLITQIRECQSQFISRQSDRVQIMNVEIVKSDTNFAQQTYNFQRPFIQIPKITYSIQKVDTGIDGTKGFQLSTVYVTKTSVTVKIQGYIGHTLKSIRIGILASDIPNSQQIIDTIPYNTGTKTYTALGPILGYCAFIHGYKVGQFLDTISIKFESSFQASTITISTQNTYMESLNFNILIIYQQKEINTFLYSYGFYASQSTSFFACGNPKLVTRSTSLSNNEHVLFGLQQIYITKTTDYYFELYPKIPNQEIVDGKVDIFINCKTGWIMSYAIDVFEATQSYCPTGRFLLQQGSNYVCTSDCSSINILTYNDSTKIFPQDYSIYPMNMCSPCYSSCQSCKGGKFNECTSCLSSFPYYYKGECLASPSVKDGMYCDSITYLCQDCLAPNCKSCDSTLLKCSQCQAGFYSFKQ